LSVLRSRTSHQPPSQDQRRYPKLRNKSERKRGGQRGHKGHTLEFVSDPDKVVNCRLETEHCSCGHPLIDLDGVPGERAQVFELPRLRLEVTEYQREVKVCPGCQQVHRGRYPAGVSAGASYGANYQGLMSYLMQRQFIPFERLADLSHELLGHRPSEGSLYRMQRRLFEQLAEVEQAIRSSESVLASLQEADLIHVDETGCYLNGSNHWVQVVSTPRLTYYSFRRTPADRDLAIL